MKILGRVLLMYALTVLWVGCGQANTPFSITISTPSNRIKSGEDLILKIVLKNPSGQKYKVRSTMAEKEAARVYGIYVQHADGTAVPETEYAENLKHPRIGQYSVAYCDLTPGSTCEDFTDVTRLHDMKRPGTYIIHVDRSPQILNEDGSPDYVGAVVTSNTITVQVTP